MSITFAGAYLHEFSGAVQQAVNLAGHDPNYAPLGLQVSGFAQASTTVPKFRATVVEAVGTDFWFHAQVFRTNSNFGGVAGGLFELFDAAGSQIAAISGNNNTMTFSGATVAGGINVSGLLPIGRLFALDIHAWQDGTTWRVELYLEGILASQLSSTHTRGALKFVDFFPTHASNIDSNPIFSEIAVTAGGEQTLGWRMASARPDGAAVINTFPVGAWDQLGNDDTAQGVATTVAGSRIAGPFEDYSGTNAPIGIRGLVQTARYIDNGSGLVLRGTLRNGSNFDNPDSEARDSSRLISVWDDNPNTGLPWQIADFETMHGGFFTAAP